MVKHIVMFRLNGDESTRHSLAAQFKTAIEALPAKIAQLQSVEVGVNDGPAAGNFDIVLTALCKDYPGLDAYSAHHEHIKCVEIIKPYIAQRTCVDYTI